MDIPKVLTIVNGPGRWDMMLAVFDGKPITLHIKEWEKIYPQGVSVSVCGGNFYGQRGGPRNEFFDFDVALPFGEDKQSRIDVSARLNLSTRRGKVENPAHAHHFRKPLRFEDLD